MTNISQKTVKNSIWLAIGLFMAILISGQLGNGEFFSIKTAFGYGGGGGGGGGSSVPSVVTSINSPMTILPSQEGTLTSNFGQQATVSVKVPTGAISGQTTFKTQMSAANANQKPANTNGAFMVGDKVFNITASDTNNNAVRNFNGNLNISIQLPDMPADVSGLGVYWFDETAGQWILVPGAVANPATGTVTFSVNHLTIFAVINGNGQAAIELAKESKPKTTGNSNKKVLGEQKYANGTLLRGSDKKIYVVSGEKLAHITTLAELAKYKGQEILDVADADINSYSQEAKEEVKVLGVESYGEGALLRGSNKKIYAVKGGKLVHIVSLKELAKYAGQKIADVDDEVIANFGKSEVLGDQKYADGVLLRGSNKKVYVVTGGKLVHIVSLQELAKYAGKEIIDVADDVIASF